MLTPEAKSLLAQTIRGTAQDAKKGLRERLLQAIHDEAERRYRLAVPLKEANLDEAHRRRRERLEAWLDERARATNAKGADLKAARARFLAQAEKEAAATLLNRLVLLRLLEASGLSKPLVLTGGWNSRGYREFREFAPGLTGGGGSSGASGDDTEGYALLLQLLFDELAGDLPGLFGDVGLTRLFPIPAATLRDVVEHLDGPGLASAWADDTTLGWVYQYWNDPDREALDAKIAGGGKISPHEIASKTQMFTERYMVEWLLQNSLGLTWLAMCKQRGWVPDAEAVLPALDARRAEWRQRREAGEVALDALMPIEGALEEQWKYYVPQPVPEDAVEKAPASVKAIKLLDPACGSGHFLVIAFDLLAALYREEARQLGTTISERAIAESILENNLHGIDIDPRAIQIAAAGLFLKAKRLAKDARPKRINLVAPALQLGNLPADDPAVIELRRDLKAEADIPEALTNTLLTALAGVDYLGSLLKVDAAIEQAIASVEQTFTTPRGQGHLFDGFRKQQLSLEDTKATILDKLEQFLAKHSTSGDLGLRLDGEQLAAGVRFVRMAKEGTYDVVVGNPPYQGISKTESFGYVAKTYPRGKADLYAAFLERSLEFARPGASAALVTMRGWMFLNQFREFRERLLREFDLKAVLDLDSGAFEAVSAAQVVLSVCCSVFLRGAPHRTATALRPTPVDDKASTGMTARKRAGLLAQVGRYEFDPRGFEVIEGEPIVYWWSSATLLEYASTPTLGSLAEPRQGLASSDNTRFLARPWEIQPLAWSRESSDDMRDRGWVPFVKGAAGRAWTESLNDIVRWSARGIEIRVLAQHLYGSYTRTIKNEGYYFRKGVAFSMIGSSFTARAHRYPGVIADKGSSVYGLPTEDVVCLLNAKRTKDVLYGLNPTISFQVGDVKRVPCVRMPGAKSIFDVIEAACDEHETAWEPSVEFVRPAASAWKYAQEWAQRAVDRESGAALPTFSPIYEGPTKEATLSFAVGIALARFRVNGGIRSPQTHGGGILFVTPDGVLDGSDEKSGALRTAWAEEPIERGMELPTYLRTRFFEYHKGLYENRPIYFPLSSAKRSFVAYVSIHRWADDTLSVLLADHLLPAKRRLDGELDDLRTARASGTNKGKTEKRFTEVQKLLEELNDFIAKVTDIAENGPPPVDDKTTKREVNAKYVMDLDDGVMVNSAALWPLLEPQWKDPKKWWKELANAQGKKDYDWSHLAARYFPTRVRAKCHEDPSLAVAHKCFWELHPPRAYAWELRLQDEIKPEFTLDEPGSDAARAAFLRDCAEQAREIEAKEQKRRAKKATKGGEEDDGPQMRLGVGGEEDLDEEAADG